MCQRYHYVSEFLQFMDSLDDLQRTTAIQLLEDFCNDHKVTHTNIVKVVFHHMCIQGSVTKAGFEGLSEKLHTKLSEAGLGRYITLRDKQIQS